VHATSAILPGDTFCGDEQNSVSRSMAEAYLTSSSPLTLPPVTAPGTHPPGDAGPATTATGGNPFPLGRWS
jgi:hypothetical protein